MTCLLCADAVRESSMNDPSRPCSFQARVEAYHDGALDAGGRAAVEQHLATCPACAAELAWLRRVSGTLNAAPTRITPAELRRVHDAVDAFIDADEPASYPISLYRTAGALMAVAASILVITAVWINELPMRPRPGPTVGVAAVEVPAWERVAINLRVDPLPNQPDGEVYLADARLADWMLQGLAGGPRPPAGETNP